MRRTRAVALVPVLLLAAVPAFADYFVPYGTITEETADRRVWTQTGYVPFAILEPTDGMTRPEDLFVDNQDRLWIADTGKGRLLSFDPRTGAWREWGRGVLKGPTGVFAAGDGRVYAADLAAERVFVFSPDGTLSAGIGRPVSPLFGKLTPFKPLKIAVDRLGMISLVSQGSISGIVQLTPEGEFLGFFGVNPTRLTVKQLVERVFFTQEQKGQLLKNLPPSPDNIAIDHDGILYTATRGIRAEAVRKLNVAGANMLPGQAWRPDYMDIAVDAEGNMFTVSQDGRIEEHDRLANLLFAFAGNDPGSPRLGLSRSPSGIGVDSSGVLFVLDRDRGVVTAYQPTEFARTVHRGISLFNRGLYAESQGPWEEALRLNDSFTLAHRAIGKALYQRQLYAEAIAEFTIGKDRQGWSQSFWEIRNAWLQARLGGLLLLIVLLPVLVAVLRRLDRRRNIFDWLRRFSAAAGRVKILSDIAFLPRFLRHPVDSYYALRRESKGSVLSATVLYAVFAVVNVSSAFVTGFLFSTVDPTTFSLGMNLVTLFAPLFLWVLANYLVSSISDGEGRLRDVYTGTVYAMAPLIIFLLPLSLVTRALTLNERFVWDFGMNILLAWSGLNLFLMVKEVHGYRVGETVRTILVTLFAMAIFALAAFVLYILVDQVRDFVYSIVQEVRIRG